MNALEQVISLLGGLTAFADALGRKPQMISNWRSRQVPAQHVLQVCRISGWVVTPHQLRPDIYPNMTDALPESVAPTPAAAYTANTVEAVPAVSAEKQPNLEGA